MPSNYYRADVRLTRETNHKLELLRREIREKTGKSVSKSTLIASIVDRFFEKTQEVKEDDAACVLPKKE